MPTGSISAGAGSPNSDAAKPRYLNRNKIPRQVASASASQARRAAVLWLSATCSAAR